MIRMVVLDMAGTTVDENMVVYKTLLTAINAAGFSFTMEQVLEEGAGKEKLQAIKSILGTFARNHDEGLADSIYQDFMVLLEKAYDTLDVLPQPHAGELFRALRQRKILIVLNTGYNRKTAESLITKIGWTIGTDLDGLVTATDVEHNRPNPDMIQLAMKWFAITDAHEVVKVGDTVIDIEEGVNAGCLLNIGITTGAHTLQQLQSAHPDHIIGNLLELLPIVEAHLSATQK